MKKTLIIFVSLLLTGINVVNAQSLFKTVYARAQEVIKNKDAIKELKSINEFQIAALDYLKAKAKENEQFDDEFLMDSQAVNLQNFINDYFQYLNEAKNISALKRAEVTKIFTAATKSHPLFNDTDTEKVSKYINNEQSLTPFCLDTDWEQAYDQATTQVKTVLK